MLKRGMLKFNFFLFFVQIFWLLVGICLFHLICLNMLWLNTYSLISFINSYIVDCFNINLVFNSVVPFKNIFIIFGLIILSLIFSYLDIRQKTVLKYISFDIYLLVMWWNLIVCYWFIFQPIERYFHFLCYLCVMMMIFWIVFFYLLPLLAKFNKLFGEKTRIFVSCFVFIILCIVIYIKYLNFYI